MNESMANRLVWTDLSSTDPGASRAFYADLLGWEVEVNPDPQYGGYAIARSGGGDVAGIGPTMTPQAPTAWMIYVGTDDADATAARVAGAGGTVVVPPFQVGDTGRMGVLRDPSGAFLGIWQPLTMRGFAAQGPNAFGWADLQARGLAGAIPFYGAVFGWKARATGGSDRAYTEFMVGDERVAGAIEMPEMVPAEVPSHWQVYFNVPDLEATSARAIAAGAHAMLASQRFRGGRFAILGDPQGGVFGLISFDPA